jgi:hypothetical protein
MRRKRLGVYYEEARGRWRVRLYKDGKVIHRSYHPTEEEAWNTWINAKRTQAQTRFEPPKIVDNPTLANLLDALLNPSV